MARPPRIPVWLPLDQPVIYFVTWCVQNRRPVLANAETLIAFQNAVARLTRWQVIAAVLMPDHVHALAYPSNREEPVADFSALVKRWMRQELTTLHIVGRAARAPSSGSPSSDSLARGPRALQWRWQPGCFDRLLRANESAQQKWEYMRENPVRAALVSKWQAWPYRIGFDPPRLHQPPSAL
jgi:REP element-mobilizing transposase RayT